MRVQISTHFHIQNSLSDFHGTCKARVLGSPRSAITTHLLKDFTTTASIFCLKQTWGLVIVAKFLVCMITSSCHQQLLWQSPGTTRPFAFLIQLPDLQFVLSVAFFPVTVYSERQCKRTEQKKQPDDFSTTVFRLSWWVATKCFRPQ